MEPHTTEDVKFVEAVEPGEMTFLLQQVDSTLRR